MHDSISVATACSVWTNLSGGTIVRYDEFRDQLEAALQRNSLYFHGLQRVETIELGRLTPTNLRTRDGQF